MFIRSEVFQRQIVFPVSQWNVWREKRQKYKLKLLVAIVTAYQSLLKAPKGSAATGIVSGLTGDTYECGAHTVRFPTNIYCCSHTCERRSLLR